MAIQTPFVFLGMVVALTVGLKGKTASSTRGWRFSAAFSLPCFGAFALYGLQSWVKVNWVAPAYLTLIPAGVALYLHRGSTSTSRFFSVVAAGARGTPYVVLFLVALAFYHLSVGIPGFPVSARAVAWRQVAQQASEMKASLKEADGRDPFLLGLDKYSIASELAFYTRGAWDTYSQDVVGANGLGYAFWSDPGKLVGRSAVAVLEARKRTKIKRLRSHFLRVEIPRAVEVSWGGRRLASFFLVRCMGYSPHYLERTVSTNLVPPTSPELIGRKAYGANRPYHRK